MKLEPAIAVNSVIIEKRDIKEIFELASHAREKFNINSYVDLRSRRDGKTDLAKNWQIAHKNSSFDITNNDDVKRAVNLSKKYNIEIAASSLYCAVGYAEDQEYIKKAVDAAHILANAAPGRTIILRLLGGDKKRIGNNYNNYFNALANLSDYCRSMNKKTNNKVILGIETHQGHFPENAADTIYLCKHIPKDLWNHIGIIEDTANRFVAAGKNDTCSVEMAKSITSCGGKVVYWHLKDVKKVVGKKHDLTESRFQRVGNKYFKFRGNIFEWKIPGEGAVDLDNSIAAAFEYGSPPHNIVCFSTEYIPATKTEEEAKRVILKYCEFIKEKCD